MSGTLFELSAMNNGAIFSPCRTWRYWLWRTWDIEKPVLNVIGLNPSTADESKDDPTIRRCLCFARDWGYGALHMTNIFAFRATLPKDMKRATDPIGPENDWWLRKIAETAGLVVAAWGANGDFRARDGAVCGMIPNLHCFRLSPKSQKPEHPLYLPSDCAKELKPVRCYYAAGAYSVEESKRKAGEE